MTEDNPRSVVGGDPWSKLRRYTPARIALGHSGTSLPTKPHLEFQLAHALARDAVHHPLDAPALAAQLQSLGHDPVMLESRAENRPTYLQRPDKGRRLAEGSIEKLKSLPKPSAPYDVVFVICDGLSALAIEENAVKFLDVMLTSLAGSDWHIAPLCIVKEGRVAIGDEIGEILNAALVAVLIGERPGLSSPDSMGLYMTMNPRVGLTDESRNCISNVRPAGLSYEEASHKLGYLMNEARRRGFSGVMLKDEAEALPQVGQVPASNFLTKD
ncbi:MAG: ethanolamine ammonia-lyase subunit EutC [Pseudomonadota bacterium]